ncbi:MAG: hypothetical protein HY301_21520, partial [Verrucomicrobia bacterium]|nr:hypothetical protein [Verrucomicrobiota bacterium]
AAIDAAHMEAFTRAPEDVSLRRLVSFGLSPQLKQNFEQIFSAPFLVEMLLAELGAEPAGDVVLRLHFDGGFQVHNNGVIVAASMPEVEAAAQKWLSETLAKQTDRAAVAEALLQAWWCVTENRSFTDALPSESERRDGWRKSVNGRVVEIGWLARKGATRAKFQMLTLAELKL